MTDLSEHVCDAQFELHPRSFEGRGLAQNGLHIWVNMQEQCQWVFRCQFVPKESIISLCVC